jgi:hypothetical protein
MTHGNGGKVAQEDDITGEGPTLVKHSATEKDGIVRASLIQELRSQPLGICAPDSGPPPSA